MTQILPSFGDLMLAVLRSDLPLSTNSTLMAMISHANFSTWEPFHMTLDKISQRAKVDRRTVQRAVSVLSSLGIVENTNPVGWVPKWEIRIDKVLDLPSVQHPELHEAKAKKESKQDDPMTPCHGATYDTMSPPHDIMSRGHDIKSQGQDTMSPPHDTVSHKSQILFPGFESPRLDDPGLTIKGASDDASHTTKKPSRLKADSKKHDVCEDAKPAELKIPKMIDSLSQRADIEAWVNLWNDIKPAERDIFLDAVQIWDAYTTNCTTNARCLTTARYRMIRGLMKTYSADDLCEVPKGVQNHTWSKQTNQTNRFEWMFQQRNIEQFIQLAQNKTSKTDGLGRMQHGDDMGEIWTFKKTRS